MSTMHKFKAYFGMVPLEDYEDDYLDDPGAPRRDDPGAPRRDDLGAPRRDGLGAPRRSPRARESYSELDDLEYAEQSAALRSGYGAGRREEFDDDPRYEAPRRPQRLEPVTARATRPTSGGGARGATRGALAVDTGVDERIDTRRPSLFDEGGTLSKITTLRPRDYSEARTIGERFRDGTPVIMDLVDMSNSDAKRLVDFAAGLAFALRGSFDKVATKVFLLSPADIDVSAEERRRIAETGFFNQK